MYKLLAGYKAALGPYELVSLRREDIRAIKCWRNEQLSILRQKEPLTDDAQVRYYESVVVPSYESTTPPLILLSYLQDGQCVGYGGLVHMDWEARRGEVSFLLETERGRNQAFHCEAFYSFLKLLIPLAFSKLKLRRITTEVYAIRPWHVAILEKVGFRYEGCLRQHVVIEDRWVDALLHGLLVGEEILS